MYKRIAAVMFLMMVMPLLCHPVSAWGEQGLIVVSAEKHSTVALYRVGEQTEAGYRILDAYGGGTVWAEDAMSPYLAQWLAQWEGEGGKLAVPDGSGLIRFTDLRPGLYLLVPYSVAGNAKPFLLTIPYANIWELQVDLAEGELLYESPKTGQHPAPILGAMGIVLSGIGLALCADRRRRK